MWYPVIWKLIFLANLRDYDYITSDLDTAQLPCWVHDPVGFNSELSILLRFKIASLFADFLLLPGPLSMSTALDTDRSSLSGNLYTFRELGLDSQELHKNLTKNIKQELFTNEKTLIVDISH